MRRLIAAVVFATLPAVVTLAQAPAPATAPAAAATAPATAPAAGLHANDFLAICGDSITEQKLYSVYIENYLIMCRPKAGLRAAQFGWGGEAAPGFLGRMSNVLRFPVTVATTCYGMNDGAYGPINDEIVKKYRDGMTGIVDTFKKSGVRFIVVGSPGAVDSKHYRPTPNADEDKVYNATLARLRDVAREVAREQGVAFADVHQVMTDVMPRAKAKYGEDYPVGGADGVHALANGQLLMAYAFLKAMGADGDIGTITVDLAANTATGTDGHKVLSAKDGVVEVESSRYPYCFSGDPKDPNATAGIVEFIPFNEELNRYRLVVANAGGDAEKLKVTWGGATREYAAADLTKGINLAAEFQTTNPFGEAFKKVEDAVRAQQNFETYLVKDLLHHLPRLSKELPEQKESFDKIAQGGLDKAKALNDAAVAAVAAVKHTIKVERVAPPPPAPPPPAPAPPAPAPATPPATAPASPPAPAPATAPAAPPAPPATPPAAGT